MVASPAPVLDLLDEVPVARTVTCKLPRSLPGKWPRTLPVLEHLTGAPAPGRQQRGCRNGA